MSLEPTRGCALAVRTVERVHAWPKRIKSGGRLRSQFTHAIDVAPTILELVGIPAPKVVDGIQQEPMKVAFAVK